MNSLIEQHSQDVIIQELLDKIKVLQQENGQLKQTLENLAVKKMVSTEQGICEMQLEKLHKSAMERELTLEETKRLDLLTKNLYLAQGKSTTIVNTPFRKINTDITDAQLIEIAAVTPDE